MYKVGGLYALIAFLVDRLNKWWFLDIFEIENKGVVEILPIFNVVMAWNKGVSFSMFSADTDTGRWLLVALTVIIVLVLIYWLKNSKHYIQSMAIGLVIGGAIGNIYDRIKFGAVADFFQFHWGEWYFAVFNVADSFIFIGAVLLIFNSSSSDDIKETQSEKTE